MRCTKRQRRRFRDGELELGLGLGLRPVAEASSGALVRHRTTDVESAWTAFRTITVPHPHPKSEPSRAETCVGDV